MQLLERGPFLHTLAEYADEARGAVTSRLVLVSGESGMGKTALLEACRAELRDGALAVGACDGLLTGRAARAAARRRRAARWPARSYVPGQERSGTAVRGVPGRAGNRPAGLTRDGVEDVHWADRRPSTCSARRPSLARMLALVLVTYREDASFAPILRSDRAPRSSTPRATRWIRVAARQLAVCELAGT